MTALFVSLRRLTLCLVLGLVVVGCDQQEETHAPEPAPVEEHAATEGMVLTPAAFTELPGWQQDDMVGAVQAL